MWSRELVIETLKEYRQIQAKSEITKVISIMESSSNGSPDLFGSYESLIHMVTGWLALLSAEERFIVQTHLIDGLDWTKTVIEYENKWGYINGRSERTLKRIQAKAIEQIIICMHEFDKNEMERN